jgi:hypothetical protein
MNTVLEPLTPGTDELSVPRSRPALSSRSRQPLGDGRLRRGVDQVVEEGAIA